MADDVLTHAYDHQAVLESMIVAAQAAGAQPTTVASRIDAPFDVGTIVRDTVTGQYGVIQHVTRQDHVGPARK